MPAWEIRPVHDVLAGRRASTPDARRPERQPEPDHRNPDRGDGERQQADGGQRAQLQRRADGDEEDHQDGRRPALHGGLERVALRDREVLDHQTGGDRGQQRFELLRGADLAEQRRTSTISTSVTSRPM